MDFDSLVNRLEASLLPGVRRNEERLRSSGLYESIKVDSMRHAERVHALGIGCVPKWAIDKSERLTFFAVLMGMESKSGRFDIKWSQTFIPSLGTGYTKREFGGYYSKLESNDLIAAFEERWKEKNGLFMKVALKGRPSHCLIRRLRGAPKDVIGIKEEVMRSVDSTSIRTPPTSPGAPSFRS